MKIKVARKTTETVEVEVEVPFYRAHDLYSDYSDSVIYSKIDVGPDGKLWKVSIHRDLRYDDDTQKWEISRERFRSDNSDEDYALGKGEYQCSASTWSEVVAEFRTALEWIKEDGNG